MSEDSDDPSLLKERIYLIFSILVSALILILFEAGVINIISFSPSLAAAIFTVIVTTTATLFSILIVHSTVIKRAHEKELLSKLSDTFKIPILVAVLGFSIAIVSSTIRFRKWIPESVYDIRSEQILSVAFIFLMLYAILSLYAAFDFVLKTTILSTIGEESDERQDE